MNMNVKLIVPAVLAAVALTACSSGSKAKPEAKAAPTAQQQTQAQAQQAQASVPNTLKVDSIDGTKEVHYKCGKDGQRTSERNVRLQRQRSCCRPSKIQRSIN